VSKKIDVTLNGYEWGILAVLVYDLFESNHVDHEKANMELCKSLDERAGKFRTRTTMSVDGSTFRVFQTAIRLARRKRGSDIFDDEGTNRAYAKVLKRSLARYKL
jgi:hypothetical protein